MGALSVEQVLIEEAVAIHGDQRPDIIEQLRKHLAGQDIELARADKDADARSGRDENRDWVKNRKAFYCALNRLNRTALCFSGGGIRSATFCLGVIQALAKHSLAGPPSSVGNPDAKPEEIEADANQSLLSRFHFLSTVSGGGYVGSWLSAWRHHNDFPTVWQNLASRPDGPDVEPPEISWLRDYSNYLTPKTGIASADTWTGVAIYLRNLILNWLVIVPAVTLLLLLLKGILTLSVGVARIQDSWGLHFIVALIGVAFLIVAQSFTTGHRPTRRIRPGGDPCHDANNIDQTAFLLHDLLWSLLSAVFLTGALTSSVGAQVAVGFTVLEVIVIGALLGVLIFAAGWLAGNPLSPNCKDFVLWAASGLVYGGLLGFGAHLYAGLMPYSEAAQGSIWMILLPVIFGVPWILISQLLADMIFVGLVSYEINSDADREWLGRAAGWVAATAIIWIVTTFITFAGGWFFIDYVYGKILAPYVAGAGGIAAVATAWIGKTASFFEKSKPGESSGKAIAAKIGMAIAGPLFAAILVVFISVGLDLLLLGDSLVDGLTDRSLSSGYIFLWLCIGFVGFGLVAWIASYSVNINRFSIHAIYRNRLVRAYLGASRQRRCPDKFTGFDADDNLPAHVLWPPKRNPVTKHNNFCLFHVVNITLNVVKTARLAWQQRKAESFTATPLHCGAAYKGYRPSKEYGGPRKPFGLSLGTAMAISGAAASPNMGYHSSPSITLLLALFNVRLGWWLGNPGKEGDKTYTQEGPDRAIVPLVDETFGLTTDTRPWVYLSDGGHFENLGLYEMVRRRCRLILAIDAGCDPDFAFEDLGNAVRKIYIDLGIRIRFKDLDKLKNRPTPEELAKAGGKIPYYAVGKIHYQEADGPGECEDGLILYVKPAYHGTGNTEGAGVRSYAMANETFPHESTADQWFSESQFESYRSLALDIMNTTLVGEEELDHGSLKDILAGLEPTARA